MDEELMLNPSRRVKYLIQEGSSDKFNPSIPIHRYYRSLNELYRLAEIYYDEKNYEYALVYFVRFATMWIEFIPHHPQYATVASEQKEKANAKIKRVLDVSEKLKKILKEKYEAETTVYLKVKEKRMAEEARIAAEKAAVEEVQRRPPSKEPSTKPPSYEESIGNNTRVISSASSSAPIGTDLTGPITYGFPPSSTRLDPAKPIAPDREKPIPAPRSIDLQPVVDRSTKPNLNGSFHRGFRDVVIPNVLIPRFFDVSEFNTSKGVETCGILGGKLCANQFVITHLIVPKQSGTSDSCTMEKEEELFDCQDKYGLITVGWIHTHPTQSAFLSSVDLHCHCGYQLLLPEAIAIVVSPKHNETGVFALNNLGMDEISNCGQAGFHPHTKDPPLFDVCSHTEYSEGNCEVIDLRNR